MTDPHDLRKIETWLRENKSDVWMAEVCEDAADDIKRLQRSVTDWQLEADVHRERAAAAVAEIARLRLTAEERKAIEDAIKTVSEALDLMNGEDSLTTATLRELLERMK
jgi:hypothetical protein